jgi:dihydrofolate reductase
MRSIVVTTTLSLDGVMQAPGRPDEDLRGGFGHGGWALPYADAVMGEEMGKAMAQALGGPMLLGRLTYENLYQSWHGRTDGNPFTEALDRADKYVASATLTEPLTWANSTLIKGDVIEAVTAMKGQPGPDIGLLGSGQLAQSLMRHNLIDRYLLLIHPLVLGSGRRLFTDGLPYAPLRLTSSVTTTTGVIIATYEAGPAHDDGN